MTLAERAAAACRRATQSTFGRAVRIAPVARTGPNSGAVAIDVARPAFDAVATFYKPAELRTEAAPGSVAAGGFDRRAVHDALPLVCRIDRPAVALRSGDYVKRVDTGETFTITGLDPDDLGTITMRLSAAADWPEGA